MRADGFAVLRTPLLPVDELLNLSAGLRGEPDPAADRAAVTAAIERLLARADVRDAIALASPSLAAALAGRDTSEPLPEKLVRAGYRYLARMCTRPTPFGLFAGTSLAQIGSATDLRLGPRAQQRRSTTVDPQILTALAERLAAEPEVRSQLRHRPNSSLYVLAGSARYARARTEGARRSYELAAAELTPALEAVLERACDGATPAQLSAVLTDGGADPAAAAAYVAQVIDAQILVDDLVPPVTGSDQMSHLTERLRTLAPPAAQTLAAARAELDELDAGGVGAAAGGYGAVGAILRELPVDADPERGLIADLTRPLAAGELGRDVVAEVRRSIELLAAIAPGRGGPGPLAEWREAFEGRFGTREVPLAEALDEELGIGFEPSTAPSADASPLLRGLPWGATLPDQSFGARGRRLLTLVERARASGSVEVELADEDVDALRAPRPARLSDALGAMVSVARRDGGFEVLLHGASGPSGARLLGRVCHADPAIALRVREHLAREEALRPDAVFAEIVHLPEGSTGKLIARPVLRAHELEYLGRSGAGEGALGLDDLRVSVRGERIVLRSRRLGRELLPRLTSAHNHARPGGLGVYRFLGALQAQGRTPGPAWSWGALEGAPFLPRVRRGRCVLARARWTLDRGELAPLVRAAGDAQRLRAAAALRERRGLPRWIAVADADNELVLDLGNVVALDTLARLAQPRAELGLVEVWPEPDALFVAGEDGRYAHELVVPFVATEPAAAPAPPRPAQGAGRVFLPGSEWLYLKLYTGTATADRLLVDLVAPVVRDALASGAAERWFFIRFADPDWHLRVRLCGDPGRLAGEVLPALHVAAERERAAGRLARLELASYDRELERYGGAAALDCCEAIFQADSEAALAIVAGRATPEDRWRLALAGTAMLLADVIEDPDQRRAVAVAMRDGYAREHDAGRDLFKAVGERWRAEGRQLTALLAQAEHGAGGELGAALAAGLDALRARSRTHAPAVARLRELAVAGELAAPLPEIASSLAHMHVNRLVRSAGRAHELVLLDLLVRAYAAREARR